MPSPEPYEVHAVRYGHNPAATAAQNFIRGDPHDGPMPLDYFVWAIRGNGRTFIVDTGFDEKMSARRRHEFLRSPGDGLKMIDIDPDTVEDVIITHMHYDHCGNHEMFPRARYHLQDLEIGYCTGRCMCHEALSRTYDVDDVTAMVRKVFAGRVAFHDGDREIAPGISVHHIGGHAKGLQVVRVWTRRGWLVVASDATHFYANMNEGRAFPIVHDHEKTLEGYGRLRELASDPGTIIPGHDPIVLDEYPAAAPGLEGIVLRLDADPRR